MSYDFSKIGIEGQEAWDNHQLNKANTLFKQQQVEQAQREEELDNSVAELMGGIAKGTPQSPDAEEPEGMNRADMLDRAGDLMVRGGASKRGMDFYEASQKMRKAEREAHDAQYDTQKKQLEVEKESAGFVERMIGTARNLSEYQYGREQVLNSDFLGDKEKAEFARAMPENPSDAEIASISKFWRDKALEAKDRAMLEEQAGDNERAERFHNDEQAYRAAQTTLQRIRDAEAARHNRVQESGGKSSATPTDVQLKTTEAAIGNQFPDMPKEAKAAAASAVSSRALQILKDNISLSWDEAMQRSLVEAQTNGDLQAGKKDDAWFGDNSKPASFRTQEGGKSKPAPLPPKGKAPVKGQYYQTSQGVARWNGSAFEAD